MLFDEGFIEGMRRSTADALAAMQRLEEGAIANSDEQRRVGHYWLRTPHLAPTEAIRADIERAVQDIRSFVSAVHTGGTKPQIAQAFFVVLVIGIGGSSLGPQLLSDALGQDDDPMILRFLDNTDPDGIDRVMADLEDLLPQTLTIVISKSGNTPETKNTMLEVAAAYERKGLSFARHAVAATQPGSELHQTALTDKWLRTFPIWDWVGGRTSITSSVGLLPAALQGVDIEAFLAGAADCDRITRNTEALRNPAMLTALMWHSAGEEQAKRNLVILPYRDRLLLLGRYLQQLVMESLGKRRSRDGEEVLQGLTVYGNKGSTDQHALVQQLVDGPDDFFVTFIEVLLDRSPGASILVGPDLTTGDYLNAFLHATRDVLTDRGRQSMTLTIGELNARSLGSLIALFERAVGLYAELIDVNAYHQPGVDLGKKTADANLDLQRRVLGLLRGQIKPADANQPRLSAWTVEQIASALNENERLETIFHILEHICANPDHGVSHVAGSTPVDARYGLGLHDR